MSSSSMLPRFHYSDKVEVLISSFLGPDIFLSTMFSNICKLCSSLKVGALDSYPCRTSRKMFSYLEL
jgi:hypothetical protein